MKLLLTNNTISETTTEAITSASRMSSLATVSPSFKEIYNYLSTKDSKLVTEGEYLTLKSMILKSMIKENSTDTLSLLILDSSDNIFNDGKDSTKFLEAYYTELENNKNAEWIADSTKEYFDLISKVVLTETADVANIIKGIDKGNINVEATEDTKYIIIYVIFYKIEKQLQSPYSLVRRTLDDGVVHKK